MNVHDFLKSLSVPEIKDYCKKNAIPAAIAMCHMEHDFNLGTVIRNANFFGFREIFYIGGKKSFDRRSTVGTHHYTDVTHCKTEDDFFKIVDEKNYFTIALENNIGDKLNDIFTFKWPENPVIIIGEEKDGIPLSILSRCECYLTIPNYGSVRSLNAGTASGIAMSFFRNYYNTHLMSK